MIHQRSSRVSATRRVLIGLAAVLAFGVTTASAGEDPLLSRLAGEWIGKGTVRMGPGSPPERIYCKVANRLVDGGSALVQKGRCAVDRNSGSLKGKIEARTPGRYQGSMDSPQTAGPAVLAGEAVEGKIIILRAEFIDRFSRRPSLSIISLEVGDGNAYRLVTNTLNPESGRHFQTGDIIFRPDR